MPRPTNGFRKIRDFLPYLWMVFAEHKGMPQLGPLGFNVDPIELPTVGTTQDLERVVARDPITVTCSFITANVNTMSCGPLGHSGKLDYIREQFLYSHSTLRLGVRKAPLA